MIKYSNLTHKMCCHVAYHTRAPIHTINAKHLFYPSFVISDIQSESYTEACKHLCTWVIHSYIYEFSLSSPASHHTHTHTQFVHHTINTQNWNQDLKFSHSNYDYDDNSHLLPFSLTVSSSSPPYFHTIHKYIYG